MSAAKKIDDVDRAVGQAVRMRRLAAGLSQTDLANALGVTFQQVQKNEKGVNRISVGRLAKIAERLNLPVTAFLPPGSVLPTGTDDLTELVQDARTVKLLRAYNDIDSPHVREAIVSMVQSVAQFGGLPQAKAA